MKKQILILLITLAVCSCATVLTGRHQQLAFESNERDTEIYINDKLVCKTPCITEVTRRNDKLMITAKKAGFTDRTMFAEGKLNPMTAVNIISLGTSTFGFSTDATSNSMWEYQPGSIYVTMQKEPRTAAERRNFDYQNKIRDFVLRNFDQLETDTYSEQGNGEYIKALSGMTSVPAYEIKSVLQNSFAGADAAEKIIGLYVTIGKRPSH